MTEIPARFDHVTSLDERPIVAIFIRSLNLSEWMAEGIFTQAFEAVAGAVEAGRTKIDGVTGST